MNPLVSVIIPAYNSASFLSATLQSVFHQDYSPVETIVIDDGSTDNTPNILSHIKNIKIYRQTNTGLPSARNKGIDLATGEYILFLDADDILGKKSISARVAHIESNPGVTSAICRNTFFHTTIGRYPVPLPFKGWPISSIDIETHLFYKNVAPPHSFLIKREIVEQTGYFDETLNACEDYDYWLRSFLNGNVFSLSPHGRVFYRKHPLSMSANISQQLQHDIRVNRRKIKLLNTHPFLLAHPYRSQFIIAAIAGTLHGLKAYIKTQGALPKYISSDISDILQLFSNIRTDESFDNPGDAAFFYYLKVLTDSKILTARYPDEFSVLEAKLSTHSFGTSFSYSQRDLIFRTIHEVFTNHKLSLFERYRFLKQCLRYLS